MDTYKETLDLSPSNPIIKAATVEAVKKMNGGDVNAAESFTAKNGAPWLATEADITFIAIYGVVKASPTSQYTNYNFKGTSWGLGGAAGASIGEMHTDYDSWTDLFNDVDGFWVQTIAYGAGILQINFFNGGTLIAQFNGAALSAGAVEGGGSGKWTAS